MITLGRRDDYIDDVTPSEMDEALEKSLLESPVKGKGDGFMDLSVELSDREIKALTASETVLCQNLEGNTSTKSVYEEAIQSPTEAGIVTPRPRVAKDPRTLTKNKRARGKAKLKKANEKSETDVETSPEDAQRTKTSRVDAEISKADASKEEAHWNIVSSKKNLKKKLTEEVSKEKAHQLNSSKPLHKGPKRPVAVIPKGKAQLAVSSKPSSSDKQNGNKPNMKRAATTRPEVAKPVSKIAKNQATMRSYRDAVASHLTVFIRKTEGSFDNDLYRQLKTELFARLDAVPPNAPTPNFSSFVLTAVGSVVAKCADERSSQWLLNQISQIDSVNNGKIYASTVDTQFRKAKFTLLDVTADEEKTSILSRIQQSNRNIGLNTSKWRLTSVLNGGIAKNGEPFTTFLALLDEESANLVASKTNGRLFYRLSSFGIEIKKARGIQNDSAPTVSVSNEQRMEQ